MNRSSLILSMAVVAGALVFVSCGSDNSASPTPQPTATPTPQPTATPTPAPTATPTPAAQACNLEPGPVATYAISPRAQVTDGAQVDIRVRARRGWDEVWCVDRSKEHRLDFNSTQKNSSNRECCWQNDPEWRIVEDNNGMVDGTNFVGDNPFNFRVRLNPRGSNGVVLVQARIDGVASHPWQANSGYRQEPIAIVAMSANQIADECTCIYRGNGVYEGANCPK